MVANSWSKVFHGIVNRNELYSQYPVFDGIEVICRYSKSDLSVSIWLRKGIAIPLNTAKYYTGTRLKNFIQTAEHAAPLLPLISLDFLSIISLDCVY